MRKPELAISHDKKNRPLVIWDNEPGMKIEFYSDELREYARLFIATAETLDKIERSKR